MSYLKDFYKEALKNKKVKLNSELQAEKRAALDESSNLDFYGTFASTLNPELQKPLNEYANKLKRQQANMVNVGLKQGLSWEDISNQTGISLDKVQAQSEQTNPEYGVQKGSSLGDKAKTVGKALTSSWDRVGSSIGDALAYDSKDVAGARNAQQTTMDTNLEIIRKAGIQLKDPNVPEEKKVKLRRLVELVGGTNQEVAQQASTEAQRVQEQLDPVKNVAAIADVGFDVVTLGTVAGAAKTANLGRQIARGAAEGATSGVFGAVEQKGSDTGIKDLAMGAGIGAAAGGVLTGGVGKLSQWMTDKAAAKAAKLADAQTANLNAPIDRAANELMSGFRFRTVR